MTHKDKAEHWRETFDGIAGQLADNQLEDDFNARFPGEKWKALVSTGLLEHIFEDGTVRDDRFSTLVSAMESLGRANRDSGLSFSFASHIASTLIPLRRFASEELRNRYLPAVRAGEVIGAHAITELNAGSDALGMRTTAVTDGDDYVLNGHKTFISNAPIANVIVVYARTGKQGSAAGITPFLVPCDTPGVTIGDSFSKMGLRTSPMSDVRLEHVRVNRANMLGNLGAGSVVLKHVMAREILCISALQIGEMRRRLDRCIAHARDREQFGRPIGANQAVAHPIVDMKLAVETARLWLADTVARLLEGKDTTLEVAGTKLVVSEANAASARQAVQIFGGLGYLTETGMEQGIRDAVAGTIYSGTSEIQRNHISALLKLPSSLGRKRVR